MRNAKFAACCFVLMTACTSGANTATQSSAAAKGPGNEGTDVKLGTAAKPDTSAKPTASTRSDPSYALMRKICASPCAGSDARVAVYRDASGQLARLRFDGSPASCSHPPRIYFDADGKELKTIGQEPVEVGSDRAKQLAADQAALTDGLVLSETLNCFEPGCCDAKRVGARSEFSCRSDSDCVGCACSPVDRAEWDRRGGPDACNIDGEECSATNPACCDGVCVMSI